MTRLSFNGLILFLKEKDMIEKCSLVLLFLLFSLTIYSKSSIDIFVSDIIINSDNSDSGSFDISSILRESLSGIGDKNFIFHSLSEILKEDSVIRREKIKNDYMAFEVCDIIGIDYLIYGRIEVFETNYEVELKLFSRKENKTILRVAKTRKDVTDLSRFLEEVLMEMDSKVNNDLVINEEKITVNKSDKKQEVIKEEKEKTEVKVVVEEVKEKEKVEDKKNDIKNKVNKIYLSNYIGIYNGVGYNLPTGDYFPVYNGVIGFETGISLVRLNLKSFKNIIFKNIILQVRPDLIFSYYIMVNKEPYAQSIFNTFQFKTFFNIGLNINLFFDIFVGLGIGFELDMLYQKYLTYSPFYTNGAFLIGLLIDSNFWFDKEKIVGLGVRNEFDFVFHADFYISYKPIIYTVIRFKEKK